MADSGRPLGHLPVRRCPSGRALSPRHRTAGHQRWSRGCDVGWGTSRVSDGGPGKKSTAQTNCGWGAVSKSVLRSRRQWSVDPRAHCRSTRCVSYPASPARSRARALRARADRNRSSFSGLSTNAAEAKSGYTRGATPSREIRFNSTACEGVGALNPSANAVVTSASKSRSLTRARDSMTPLRTNEPRSRGDRPALQSRPRRPRRSLRSLAIAHQPTVRRSRRSGPGAPGCGHRLVGRL